MTGTYFDSYEIGYGAEVGWKAIEEGSSDPPPFDYVSHLLHERINNIRTLTNSEEYILFLTDGRTFRYDLARTKPYKGTRVNAKPFHYDNLTVYMRDCLPCQVARQIEADDAMALEHVSSKGTTIVCSRDKDLRQLPGWTYSWELGSQSSYGPIEVCETGELYLSKDKKKLSGNGYAFFCAQLLMGDVADNIPGLKGVGPVAAYNTLSHCKTSEELYEAIEFSYQGMQDYLLEQGRLLWLTRSLDNYGYPNLWQLGQLR